MELHYINMRAFIEERHGQDIQADMFTKWLMLITQSEQNNKEFLKEICKEDEVIAMALGILASLSVDEATRLAYMRRKDEMTNYYATLQRAEEYRQALHRAVSAMRTKNWTVAEIAEALGHPEEEINKFLT